VERVTCRKPTAKVAEERGLIYARRWVDRHGDSRVTRGRPWGSPRRYWPCRACSRPS